MRRATQLSEQTELAEAALDLLPDGVTLSTAVRDESGRAVDVRLAYMDVAPTVAANGHTVLLLHGNNFGGFYFKAIIDGLKDFPAPPADKAGDGLAGAGGGGGAEGIPPPTPLVVDIP